VEALASVTTAYNATPHSRVGESPYYLMFEFEPTLPGWQNFRTENEYEAIPSARKETRERIAVRAHMLTEERALAPSKVAKGDYVVWPLAASERAAEAADVGRGLRSTVKYTPKWSLPAKVVELRGATAHVKALGTPDLLQQVPLSVLRVIPPTMPRTLVPLNLSMIDRMPARHQVLGASPAVPQEAVAVDEALNEYGFPIPSIAPK
jgi:hypothetical protein